MGLSDFKFLMTLIVMVAHVSWVVMMVRGHVVRVGYLHPTTVLSGHSLGLQICGWMPYPLSHLTTPLSSFNGSAVWTDLPKWDSLFL